jgi:hypothetical protein
MDVNQLHWLGIGLLGTANKRMLFASSEES